MCSDAKKARFSIHAGRILTQMIRKIQGQQKAKRRRSPIWLNILDKSFVDLDRSSYTDSSQGRRTTAASFPFDREPDGKSFANSKRRV